MVSGVLHVDWLNENRNRRYPFFDGATLRDQTGTLTLPNELIVDFNFPVHALTYNLSGFYLKEITVFGGGLVLSIGYGADVIASRSITAAEHTENKQYHIEGRGAFADSVGRIAIGKLDEIWKYGGTFRFDATATPLLPTTLRPSLRGVISLRIVNSSNEISGLLQDDIELVAGENIGLTMVDAGGGLKRLRISAQPNEDFLEDCECPDQTQREPIYTINGVGPDSGGNLQLEGLGCVVVNNTAVANGIRLEDSCAEPCCGCAELDVIRTELDKWVTQTNTQLNYAQRLMSAVEQLRTSILASKLGTAAPC